MKIAIIGTHGIGKTTLALEIASEAKRRGKNAYVIQEVARRCPFPLNDDFTVDGANWIITSQINKELQAKAEGYDYIICDRSAYDPICYLNAGGHPQKNFDILRWYAQEWLKTYDVIFFLVPSGSKPLDDGIRSTDLKFQMEVHEEFEEVYYGTFLENIKRIDANLAFSGELGKIYQEVFA